MIIKKTILFLLLVVVFCNLFATDDDSFIICDRIVANSSGNCIELELKLIDKINENELPAYCGSSAYCRNYDFKIIKVINGIYADSIITINIICPRDQYDKKKLDSDSIYIHKVKFLKTYFISQNLQKTTKKEISIYEIVK